jgi:hypothetical protein
MAEKNVVHKPAYYQIRIKGHLGEVSAQAFNGMQIVLQVNGETLLSGTVVDQAALFGILIRIRDLGIPLLSVVSMNNAKESR